MKASEGLELVHQADLPARSGLVQVQRLQLHYFMA